ncbi:MAG: hypothetical protein IJX01_09015 [Oscillospiraceae bacterium]|nr:hypothetical protein [Oscillospiraceae bacterium]
MKRTLAWLLTVCVFLSMTACSSKQGDPISNSTPTEAATDSTISTPTPTTPSKAIQHRTLVDLGLFYSPEAYAKVLEDFALPEESNTPLDIPIYYEDDLLFHRDNHFTLTRDLSSLSKHPMHTSGESYYAITTLKELPTVLRVRTDGSAYAVYDTDTGYRFYLFFDKTRPILTGYPIVINKSKMLSYSDFKDIQVGDPIEKVELIDDVASLHKKQLALQDFINSIYYENCAKNGYPVSSIHYLKDGILQFEYLMPEEKGKLIISRINLYQDFVIPTVDGEMTSHKIKNIDLPVS